MDKRFLTILAVIVLAFVGFVAFGNKSDNKSDTSSVATSQANSHIKGQGQKNVTLVEFGDFECSACFAYEPIVKQVVEKNQNDIRFQFRNLPLVSIHTKAFSAARAAEAAALQNKFWEMHNSLYEPSNWQVWTRSDNPVPQFEAYAQKLGLNLEQFKKDHGSSKVNDVINADMADFNKTGQPMATPSFFIDGQLLELKTLVDETGQPTVEKFQAAIDSAIAKKTQQ